MFVREFEDQARKKLEPKVFDYFAGGALDERALAENERAFKQFSICHRILRGRINPDPSITLLGQNFSMPILVSPVAFQGMANSVGEVGTARACAEAGIAMVLSTTSNCAIADVGLAANGALWMQLYLMKDRGITTELVRRAEAANCKAIALTVDVPAWGRRERDMRNHFSLPSSLVIQSLLIPGREDFYDGQFRTDLGTFLNERLKFDLTWDDFSWLQSITKLPIVVKGIAHPEDARLAVDKGAAAIYVSNHGGRQLDIAPATLETLPIIVEAVEGRVPVIMDGGIRRGTDVVIALAMGAQAVGIGRPVLWGLTANGQDGVREVLETFRAEIRNAMALCGCDTVGAIAKERVRKRLL